LVELLLKRGANAAKPSERGNTALHLAALQGGPDVVRILLKHNADPNALNEQHQTPLHLAISGDGDLEVIKLLVNAGAKLNIPNNEGITPVRLASIRGENKAYDFLLAAAGGKEPAPTAPLAKKSVQQLIAELSSDKREIRIAAQRELVTRGKDVMPDLLKAIDAGSNIAPFYELFQAMGPNAEAALPTLEAKLAEKNHVYMAAITIERIKPGGIAKLSNETKQKAAQGLQQALIDPKIDVAAGVHARLLISLGQPAVPVVLQLLRHTKPEIRAFMARQLEYANFQSDEVRAELLRLQTEDPDPEVRAKASQGLANPKFHSIQAKSALIKRLRTPPVDIIWSPNQTDAEREAAAAKRRQVEALLDETAKALASYGPAIVDDLLPIARNEDDLASKQVPNVWNKLGPDAVPKFESLLTDNDPNVRRLAYQQIGRLALESPAALSILRDHLNNDDPQHRQFAADAAVQNRVALKPLRPAIFSLLSDNQIKLRTRLSLVLTISRIDPPAAKSADEVREFLPEIIEAAKSGEYFDRCIALELLGSLGSAAVDARPQLQRIVKEPAPPLPTGPRPRVGEEMTEEWKKAAVAQHQTIMIRQLASEAIKQIEEDLPAK
jgi:hypothetical protein